MDRTVNSAPTEQRGIRRVYDCLDILFGDVADDNPHTAIEKTLYRFRVQALACRLLAEAT
jgi:hypothetical protein